MIKMIEIKTIQSFICFSCVSEMLAEGFSDSVESIEMIYDERVAQPIIRMMDDQGREILLMMDRNAQHKQDDDDDVEIECYI